MIKNRFIFILLSALYILFVSKADLYSKLILSPQSTNCCEDEVEDNTCCGNELNDGKCQSNSCCHITSTSVPTSISISNYKVDVSCTQSIPFINTSKSEFFTSSFYNFSIIGKLIYADLSPIVSIFQHYLAFINTWIC